MVGWNGQRLAIPRFVEPGAGPATPTEDTPGSEHFTFDPSGRWLVSARPGGFTLHDLRIGKEHTPLNLPPNEGALAGGPIAVNRSGTVLAVASSPYTIQLWRMPQKSEPSEVELITTLARGITWRASLSAPTACGWVQLPKIPKGR
jgi:hypothetical protein